MWISFPQYTTTSLINKLETKIWKGYFCVIKNDVPDDNRCEEGLERSKFVVKFSHINKAASQTFPQLSEGFRS